MSARLSAVQGAEVEVCKGCLLLGGEAEGLGGRRQDGLQSGELAVEVADVHQLFDGRQERWFYFLGQQGFPVDRLKDRVRTGEKTGSAFIFKSLKKENEK